MVSVQARGAFVQYLHTCAGERVCLCLSEEGREGCSSDKPPHLGCFRRSERSCGEAFISETRGEKIKRDRIKMV